MTNKAEALRTRASQAVFTAHIQQLWSSVMAGSDIENVSWRSIIDRKREVRGICEFILFPRI